MYTGKKEVEGVYVGTKEIASIYKGNMLVYDACNLRTSDNYILYTSDNKSVNVKKE
jgi:hypothetical protein